MERGWFRAYVLSLKDRPVAFWYGSGIGGCLHDGDSRATTRPTRICA